MVKKIFFLCLFSLVLYACGNNGNNKISYSLYDVPIAIDINNTTDIKFDTISNKHVKYIPLETNSNCLIGSVEKIIIKQEKIFVADFTTAKALFVFDLYGNFLFKIDRKGKGPGEYINFYDFDITSNCEIYIWDINSCKFLVFDSNGTFVKEMRMKYQADSFCVMDQTIYLSRIKERGIISVNLMSYSLSTQKYKNIIDGRGIYDSKLVNSSYHQFYYSQYNTYYVPRFSEIIYSINSEQILPAIGLMNLHIPPKDIINQWNRQPNLMIDDPEYVKDITYVLETKDYISFTIEGGFFFNLIYDKKNQKSYRLNPLYKSIGIPFIMGSADDKFIGVLNPDIKNLSHIINREQNLSGLTEDSNPVVVMFDFHF